MKVWKFQINKIIQRNFPFKSMTGYYITQEEETTDVLKLHIKHHLHKLFPGIKFKELKITATYESPLILTKIE